MLEIRSVSKKFRKKEALSSVNLQLKQGIYGVLGDNGAGKTTLLRCIAGLYQPTKGKICWNQKDVMTSKEYQSILGYLPQEFEGLKELKVREFLEYFGDLKNVSQKELPEMIDSVLAAVNLSEKKEDKVRTLSGGMRRRLGIAQALLNHPQVLLFDEPTAGLDPKERLRFQNLILDNRQSNGIVLISTHIVSDIEALCDYILVMKSGKIIGVYSPEQLADEAGGKVYQLTENQYEQQKSHCIMITKTQEKNQTLIRVLSEEVLDGKLTESAVEDGYIWITREV